jgi:alkyl sulfatase BDS1-like metallo-beta-lactamase superfamily hydrolase
LPSHLDAIVGAVDPAKLDETEFVRLIEVFEMLTRTDTGIDLTSVDTATLVTLIARASQEQLAALTESATARTLVFNEVFDRMSRHLRADKATSAEGIIRWRIGTKEQGYERFHTTISGGVCETTVDCPREPKVTLTLAGPDFLRLATGTAGITTMLAARRLAVRGDLRYALRVNGLFDIPKPRSN